MEKRKYRTVFISDIHLGSNGCQAKEICRFLKYIECEKIYLVGDIIDMWRLRQRWYWPANHNDVVRRILKMAKNGTQVIFVPGNHDEAARQYVGLEFGGVKVMAMDVHETIDGRRLLVTHGDQYDLVVKHSRLLSVMGSVAYEWLIGINTYYNKARLLFGYRYWSLSQYMKLKVKHACTFISRFEQTLIAEAKRRRLDGVVCGHIHHSECRVEAGIAYYNCGDWIESCSVLVEKESGEIQIVDGIAMVKEVRESRRRKKQLQLVGEQAKPELVCAG